MIVSSERRREPGEESGPPARPDGIAGTYIPGFCVHARWASGIPAPLIVMHDITNRQLAALMVLSATISALIVANFWLWSLR